MLLRTTGIVVVLAALAFAGEVHAQQATIGRLAIVCVGEAHYQPHGWAIENGMTVAWEHVRCGERKLINLDVQLINEPAGNHGLTLDFYLNRQPVGRTESSRPWRMFGDAGRRNDGSYVWRPGRYTVDVYLTDRGGPLVASHSWEFRIAADPVPVVDHEQEFLDAMYWALVISTDRKREIRRTLGNLTNASDVRRLLVEAVDMACSRGSGCND